MSAGASSSHNNPPRSTTTTSDIWKAALGSAGAGNDLTWDQLYYVEKNTFLEFGDQEEFEGQSRPLRRVHSDSSLSSLGAGSVRGAFASTASNATNAAPQARWHHGCYMKYRLGACHAPNCTYLHDLDGKETAAFIAWTQREHHVVFRSDRSDSSVHPGAGHRESRDLGDDSDISSYDNAEEAPPDSSDRRDNQQKTRGYQDLAEQLREQFMDCNSDDELAALLPRDSAGQPTTIGSTLHASNQCKPCRHKMASQPCTDGLWCLYCHMDHELCAAVGSASHQRVADGNGRSKARPCKGKRDRYRKHVSKISEQIMADPFSWSAETMEVPPSIEGNPDLKRKFMARMAAIAEHARTQVAQAAASSGAASSTIQLQNAGGSSTGIHADSGAQHLSAASEAARPRNLLSL